MILLTTWLKGRGSCNLGQVFMVNDARARVLDLGAATDSRRSRAAGAAAADAAQLDHDGDTVSGSPCSPAATEDDCGA